MISLVRWPTGIRSKTFCSTNPCLRPSRKSATRTSIPSAEATESHPITGIATGCARAASGHATAAPPRSVTNSRRLMELPILPRLPGELKAFTFGTTSVVHHSKIDTDWRLRVNTSRPACLAAMAEIPPIPAVTTLGSQLTLRANC
jgi:hypothetical protein